MLCTVLALLLVVPVWSTWLALGEVPAMSRTIAATIGHILVSPNASDGSWIKRADSPFRTAARSAVFAPILNVWCAVGSGGNHTLALSYDDGLSWQGRLSPCRSERRGSDRLLLCTSLTLLDSATGLGSTVFSVTGNGVAFGLDSGNPRFVAVGEGGNSIATSANGSVWTGLNTTVFFSAGNGVAFNSGANSPLW